MKKPRTKGFLFANVFWNTCLKWLLNTVLVREETVLSCRKPKSGKHRPTIFTFFKKK